MSTKLREQSVPIEEGLDLMATECPIAFKRFRYALSSLPIRMREAAILREAGYSQSEVAVYYGVSQQAVSKWLKKAEKRVVIRADLSLLYK